MASKNEVYARVADMRRVFRLGDSEESANALTVSCWGDGRKRYLITLVINSEKSIFFAATTGAACDTLRTITYTLFLVMPAED